MNDTNIKVLLVEPEKYPKEIVIDDSLEAVSYTHLDVYKRQQLSVMLYRKIRLHQ